MDLVDLTKDDGGGGGRGLSPSSRRFGDVVEIVSLPPPPPPGTGPRRRGRKPAASLPDPPGIDLTVPDPGGRGTAPRGAAAVGDDGGGGLDPDADPTAVPPRRKRRRQRTVPSRDDDEDDDNDACAFEDVSVVSLPGRRRKLSHRALSDADGGAAFAAAPRPPAAAASIDRGEDAAWDESRASSAAALVWEEDAKKPPAAATAGDASLAARLQTEEEERARADRARREGEERRAMEGTLSGRAWLFVRKVLDLHTRLGRLGLPSSAAAVASAASGPDPDPHPAIETVAVDDMVAMAERLLGAQSELAGSWRPTAVDVGYHYTQEQNMGHIRQDGLMTCAERSQNGIDAQRRGSYYGDGIYTGNNPYAFRHFGEVGLLVARLQGRVLRVERTPPTGQGRIKIDTVIGNKGTPVFSDEVVLLRSAQCLPLIRFSSSLISATDKDSQGNWIIRTYHLELQKIIDGFFNDGEKTDVASLMDTQPTGTATLAPAVPAHLVPPPFPATAPRTQPLPIHAPAPGPPLRPATNPILQSPSSLPPTAHTEVSHYNAPLALATFSTDDAFRNFVFLPGDCPICRVSLYSAKRVVCLKVCGHAFHRGCIKATLDLTPFKRCPTCRKSVNEPQGKSPSGTMTITKTSASICRGITGGTIMITYQLPSGAQKTYHDHPGLNYDGTTRLAFLPDNSDGRRLLRRLKYAFTKGLTFTIGTSLTTGQSDCIVWSSIPHKTDSTGAVPAHGFPDGGYFVVCNDELDNLGVPPSDQCP